MAALRTIGRWTGTIGAAAVLVGLLGVVGWTFAISWRPSPATYPLQGVDVSAAQGAVDWATVRAGGADFAYARATEGADGRDPRFAENWRAIYAAGLRRGAIHVFSLCRLAVDQANNFVVTVPRAGDALPAAVEIDFADDCDARPDRAVLVGEVGRFLRQVETHTGKPVMLAVSERFEAAYRLSAAFERPVWSVADFFPPAYAARPWRMWRASDIRRIEGVAGPVNWDVVAP